MKAGWYGRSVFFSVYKMAEKRRNRTNILVLEYCFWFCTLPNKEIRSNKAKKEPRTKKASLKAIKIKKELGMILRLLLTKEEK